jgi:pSer/pThr/pTyr-binding forkhead associated (FHA) protein
LRVGFDANSSGRSFSIEDLRSTNGTFVDGRRVSPGPDKAVPLPVGATLSIGGCQIRFIRG